MWQAVHWCVDAPPSEDFDDGSNLSGRATFCDVDRELVAFEAEPFPSPDGGKYSGEEAALADLEARLGKEVFSRLKASPYLLLKRVVRGQLARGPEATAEAAREVLGWRERAGADGLLGRDLGAAAEAVCVDIWPTRFGGPDRFGHPVVFERVGLVDPAALVARCGGDPPAGSSQVSLGAGGVGGAALQGPELLLMARAQLLEALALEASASCCTRRHRQAGTAAELVGPEVGGAGFEPCQSVWVIDMSGLVTGHFSGAFKDLMVSLGHLHNKVPDFSPVHCCHHFWTF